VTGHGYRFGEWKKARERCAGDSEASATK